MTPENHNHPDTCLDTAIKATQSGISVIPILPYSERDGSKRPAVAWKQYQQTRPDMTQVKQWFTNNQTYGIAAICGSVSGNLVMLEVEAAAAHRLDDLQAEAMRRGIGGLWGKMCGGCFERTPSGGYHWYAHLILKDGETMPRNTKLAHTQNPDGTSHVLAETRGEGGYSVIAPSPATCHENGKPWQTLSGHVYDAPTLTMNEYTQFTNLLTTLDETSPVQAQKQAFNAPNTHNQTNTLPTLKTPLETGNTAGVSVGDDFEARTSWEEILAPHGWEKQGTQGSTTFWRRPGKQQGISASTGYANDRDRLYVWTTSTTFDAETPYTKFAAYTLLNHGGDYTQAVKTLAGQGYGTPAIAPNCITKLDNTTPDTTINPLAALQQTQPVTGIMAYTDYGNSLKFINAYKDSFKYVPERKKWAAWNGARWDIAEGDALAVQAALALGENLPEETKPETAHKKHSLCKSGIMDMLALTATNPKMREPVTNFDTNPYELNTPAGTVDLKTGKLYEPTPTRLCLRSTTIAPDWNMPTPVWDMFLADTFKGNSELAGYVKRFLGMTLIGRVQEQVFASFNGAGANGKSTLLNAVQKILGIGELGYSTTIQSNMFLAGAENRHPTEIAALAGVRLAVTSETEEGQHFAEARVKLLTGADSISARFMRGDFFSFTPTHTIVMVSNYEPEVASGGTAFWRRVRKIPFNNIVPEAKRDSRLEEKLFSEGAGILAWLIDGCREYLAGGLREPVSVRVATSEYEQSQDSVGLFVKECCVLGDPAFMQTPVGVFRAKYEQWCAVNGYRVVNSPRLLTTSLKSRGVETVRNNSMRFYSGLLIENR